MMDGGWTRLKGGRGGWGMASKTRETEIKTQ